MKRVQIGVMRGLAGACLLGALMSAAPALAQDYDPVFPNADAGADPAVPAEMGGKGFAEVAEKLGFTTNTDFKPVGSLKAKKGGEIRQDLPDYPSNFRPYGPQANTSLNYLARELMFDTLLYLHPNTQEWTPQLATHWKKSADGLTFTYRINPNAKWKDGSPVTAEDVLYTYRLLVDSTLGAPSTNVTYGKFEEPKVLSKYMVSVKQKIKNWRNFLYFSGSTYILPAKILKKYLDPAKEGAEPLGAKQWVSDFNTSFMMPSGPYEMVKEDQKAGISVTLRRRKDFWGWGTRRAQTMYNFDRITYIIVQDKTIAWERLRKGEPGDINISLVNTARRWVVEMRPKKEPLMKRGLIQKRKIFNEQPQGYAGIAMNMKRGPLKDVRVRKALALLLNRKRLLKELMYNQYMKLRSYWPGTRYENESNPRNDYDPRTALKLLAEAGYKTRNSSGQLVNDKGETLNFKLTYSSPGFERHLTMYQESLKRAGITLQLERVPNDQRWQKLQEKKYELLMTSWGALLFPNPETSWLGKYGDDLNTNNVSGFKNDRVDELIKLYDTLEIEQLAKRVEIIKEIDGIVANAYPYVLFWYAPYQRFVFWNVFGIPECGLSRVEDYNDAQKLWWWDAEKAATVEKGKADESVTMPVGKTSIRYWKELEKKKSGGK